MATVAKSQRASSIATVSVSGSNAPFDSPLGYSVDVFVQLRSDLPTCPRAFGDELNNVINLGSSSIQQIARSYDVGEQGLFRFRFTHRAGSSRRVVYCAYTRLITDDAAYAQLRHTSAKPRQR